VAEVWITCVRVWGVCAHALVCGAGLFPFVNARISERVRMRACMSMCL
jgi:hypothetical protein